MKSGTRPCRPDHRDYDLRKTRKFGSVATLPEYYTVDANLWKPNQEVPCTLFNPVVPALPFGCTDYAQSDICIDEDGVLHNPMDIENITHANARGGLDVRTALDVVTKLYPTQHPAYFRITQNGAIDFFDAVRLSMLSTSSEKRGVSIGSPFWSLWNTVGTSGILPMPDYELVNASWHNWVVKGWMTIDGVCYLTCQMLQGENYGDKGYAYITREMFNKTMAVRGAVAFTIDKVLPGEQVQTVDMNIVQMIVSYVRRLFGL